MNEDQIPKKEGTDNPTDNQNNLGSSFSVSDLPPKTISIKIPAKKTESTDTSAQKVPAKPPFTTVVPQKKPASDGFSKKTYAPQTERTMTPSISEKEIEEISATKKPKPIVISIPKGSIPDIAPITQQKEEPRAVRFSIPSSPEKSLTNTTGGRLPPKPITILPPKPREEIKKPEANAPNIEDVSETPTIRTFKQDVAGAIKNQKTSLVRMVLEEQKGRAKRELEESPTSRKNLPIIIISIIFFLISAGAIYYTFFGKIPPSTLTAINSVPVIYTQQSKEFSIDGVFKKDLLKSISDEIKGTALKLDSIEYLYFTTNTTIQTEGGPIQEKAMVSSSDFFSLFGIILPDRLSRTLQPDFMLGIHAFNNNQPFLILKVGFYDTALAGMLEWEKTIPKDILPIFGRPDKVNEILGEPWTDLVIKNNDTRVLRNPDNSIALMYMFKGEKTIIITTDEDTLLKISGQVDLIKEKKTQ